MYDQSFNPRTLSRCFKPEDFHKNRALSLESVREKVISSAIQRYKNGFLGYNLRSSVLRGKKVYWADELADTLVLRKVKNDVSRLYKLKLPSRTIIVDTLNVFLSECTQYKLYRLDIFSFYESFNKDYIFKKIESLERLEIKTKKLLNELLYSFYLTGGEGIPRGLSLSAYLAELLMCDFDNNMKSNEFVFYYARYVDDIVIITNGFEDSDVFINNVKSILPDGLRFNEGKKYYISALIPKVSKKTNIAYPANLLTFEYLGYDFSVSEKIEECKIRGGHRLIGIDLAYAKANKIKSRIIYSIIDYNKTNDFELLCERLKFLSTNFSVLDSGRVLKRLSGIHFNYPLIDAKASKRLAELDVFLRKAVLSSNGKVFFDFHTNLNQYKKYRLLKISFVRGHEKRHFFHYSASKMMRIQRCWRYV
ncbi:TPA: RNA-directed DNA polymerase [Serratia marcescens]|nr:RNA-directed DNA polymerase [Serratia marcescens]